MTCSAQVLLAARDHVLYFEKMREALELASSTEAPVTVYDFYAVTGKKTEIIDCCGFVIFNEEFADKEVAGLGEIFSVLMCKLLGKYPVLTEQKILFLHHSEIDLIEMLCEMFCLSKDDMLDFGVGEERCAYSFFSLDRDFAASRHRRIVNERITQQQRSIH